MEKTNIVYIIVTIEYNPNRNGEKRYIDLNA